MNASVVLNLINVVFVAAAMLTAVKQGEDARILFRYFTVLSNLLCAAASLVMAVAQLGGSVPYGISVFKYVGTCAISVTFLTVMFFLGPAAGGYKDLLNGRDMMLHLLCPVLAIVSYCFFEQAAMPFGMVFLGVLPVLLYGILYLYKVVFAPEKKRWEDFYTFNRGGKWPLSFAAMIVGAFVVSVILWAV